MNIFANIWNKIAFVWRTCISKTILLGIILMYLIWKLTYCAINYSSTSNSDIDECTEYNETLCASNRNCENIDGSYVCLCSTGFGGVNCEDGKKAFGLVR